MGKVKIQGKVNVNTVDGTYKYNYNDYLNFYNNLEPYVRPSGWPTIPAFTGDTEQVVYGLYNVEPDLYDDYLVISAEGDYTVDWGDGSAAENISSGVRAEHLYTYSGITGGTLQDDGSIICLVTIRPNGGNLTKIELGLRPSKFDNPTNINWKEVVMNVPNATGIYFYSTESYLNAVESVYIYKNSVVNLGTQLFYTCRNLKNAYVDTSGWTSLYRAFRGCTDLTNVYLTDTSSCTNFNEMFYYCYALRTICEIDTSIGTVFRSMFNQCLLLEQIPPLDLSSANDISSIFSTCKSLRSIPPIDISGVSDLYGSFGRLERIQYIPDLDCTNVSDTRYAFQGTLCKIPPKLLNFNTTTPVTQMNTMFSECNFRTLPEGLDTSNNTNFLEFFQNCNISDISSIDTSSGENFNEMFRGAKFQNTYEIPYMDLSNGTNFGYMFYYSVGQAILPEGLDTSKGTVFENMFAYGQSFRRIPYFCTTGCTNFTNMFSRAYTIQIIEELDFSNATNMTNTFYLTTRLRRCKVIGPAISHSYNDCSLGPDALNEIFTNLPSVGSATITVTNNWGVDEAGYDPSIATAKGWTVAD